MDKLRFAEGYTKVDKFRSCLELSQVWGHSQLDTSEWIEVYIGDVSVSSAKNKVKIGDQ